MAPTRATTARTMRLLRLALVLSISLPTVLFIGAAWFERERLLADAADDAIRTTATLREHTLKALETHELLIREVDRRIQGLTWDQIRASARSLSAELSAMHANLPQVSTLGITDNEGRLWAASVAPLDGPYTVVSHREFWSGQKSADAGTFISRSYVGMNTQRVNFGISRRRSGQGDAFDGTVHVAVQTTYFSQLWSEATRGLRDASVALIRTDGEVLARFPAPSEPLPRLSREENPVMRAVAEGRSEGVVWGPSAAGSTERLAAFALVGPYPILVTYSVPKETVLSLWGRRIGALGATFALTAGGLALVILLAIRQTRRLAAAQTELDDVAHATRENQRPEVLGRLAADLAHDLNNLVQAVLAAALLTQKASADPGRIRAIGVMLEDAASRGARVTRQILDLSRREGLDQSDAGDLTCDLAEAVSSVCSLLAATLGPTHSLRCEITRDGLPGFVRGDRAGLEAAIMSLAANARDAMRSGGDVVVRVAPEPGTDDAAAGGFVRISVTDTGDGIPPAVLARIGEPFFTTKPRGRGTGLGVAAVRAYAERAGGRVDIESRLGAGTTVSVLLPAAANVQQAGGKVIPFEGRRRSTGV